MSLIFVINLCLRIIVRRKYFNLTFRENSSNTRKDVYDHVQFLPSSREVAFVVCRHVFDKLKCSAGGR